MNIRGHIERLLVEAGYKIVERNSDVSDPFAWLIVARLGDYDITVQERVRALADR